MYIVEFFGWALCEGQVVKLLEVGFVFVVYEQFFCGG